MTTPQLYYSFDNNSSVRDNILLNDAYSPSTTASTALPITSNLYARYEAKNYNAAAKTWTDSGPNGRHIAASAVTGTPTIVTYADSNTIITSHNYNGLFRNYTAVKGGTTDRINLGNEQLNSWTLFAIARYAGANRRRILSTSSINFLSGHWQGCAGVAFHEGWLTGQTDYYVNNFFINTDTAAKMYTNGVIRGNGGNSVSYLPPLNINNDRYSEFSDWEVIDIIFYNTELSDENKRAVELFLSSYYGIANSNANNTVISAILYNSPTFSATDYNKGQSSMVLTGGAAVSASPYVQLPSFFTAAGTGLTFALWFKSNNSITWSRLFDFGNGAGNSNILIGIYENNLALSVYGANGVCQPANVYPSCNDNVWRHLVWTISSDGLTWKIYINGSLYATITAANVSSYSQQGSVGPIYPNNVLRTLNYIGKSNWGDSYLAGGIDEFYFYNTEIGQSTVSTLYNNATNVVPTNKNYSISYKKSENPIYPAVGTIMQYYGTTEPPGWLLCDGVIRTATDSRYSNLAQLLGGNNTANSLRPPDLRTRILHGTSSSMPINNVGGSTTFALLETHLPQHAHSGTLSTNGNHTHSNVYSWYGNNNILHHTQSDRMSSGFHGDAGNNSSSGNAIQSGGSHGHTLSLDNGPGRGFPINILPSCYKVNHIIKY